MPSRIMSPICAACWSREPMLTASSLNKSYGTLKAVQDVSLSVASGQIVGLLGPNGAGKSTTVAMLCGHHDTRCRHGDGRWSHAQGRR